MIVPRSKSAPNGVPALIPGPLVRAASFHTIEEVVKDTKSERLVDAEERREEERSDAFNLSGFFPGEKKWNWMGEEEAKGGVKTESLFGASDRMTQEVIKGEDKLGVLSLGELLKRLGRALETETEDGRSRKRMSGIVDETSVWQLGYREDCQWTASLGGGDHDYHEDYIPIWDIDPGNSRDTKIPHVG